MTRKDLTGRVWIDSNGCFHIIDKMTENHLENAIRALKYKKVLRKNDSLRNAYITVLQAELFWRKLYLQ